MIELKKNLLDSLKTLDQNVSLSIYRFCGRQLGHRLPSYQWLLKALEYSCHGIPWFTITIISLYLTKNNKSVAQLLIGLILDIIYVAILKASTRRRRPHYARQDDQKMVMGVDKMSFPSGHASRAIYVALFFSNHSIFSLLIWIWSLSVCVSRLLLGRHYLFDVICGAFLGYINFCLQFIIFKPINSLLLWTISALFNVAFSDPNDFD